MRIHPEKERTIDLLLFPIEANRLGDGEDVVFIKTFLQRGTAMSRSAEFNSLSGQRGIWDARIVGIDEIRNVNKHVRRRRFSCKRAYLQGSISSFFGGSDCLWS